MSGIPLKTQHSHQPRNLAGRLGWQRFSLLGLVAFLLLASNVASAQEEIYYVFPDRIAQGYPTNAATFRLDLAFTGLSGEPGAVYWINGGTPVLLPFSPNTPLNQFSATVDAPRAISASLGDKTIRVCPVANANDPGCTDDAASEKLRVVRPQVTRVEEPQVTQGADSQVISLEYLLARSDGPVENPTVYLVDAQGQETELVVDYYDNPEGSTSYRFVEVVVPDSIFENLATYKFRVEETFSEGGEGPDVTESTELSATQATLDVVAPAVFTTSSPLPPAQLGQSYSTVIAATGGYPYPGEGDDYYLYSVEEGSTLPSGLFLSGSFDLTVALTGTANGPAGKYTFTLSVRDYYGVRTTKQFRMGVQTPADPLSITTTTFPQGRANEFYATSLQAAGGVPSYTFAIAEGGRPLPTGLELQPDGTVIGVPTTQGTFIVDVYAEDSQLRQATKAISMTILPPFPPVVLTTQSPLPPGRATQPYDLQFQATGGVPPYMFYSGEGGNPPPGLTLSSSGRLTGTPTTPGTYEFGVAVIDSRFQQTADTISDFKMYTLVIEQAVPPPQFTTESLLPMGEVGTPYLAKLEAKDGVAPITFRVGLGLLPGGLSINEQTGVISGTPTTASETTFLAEVFDSIGRSSPRYFTITIKAVEERVPISIITTGPLPGGVLGDPYSVTIAATGGVPPYAFTVSAGALPPGLTLNAQTGAITGTPTAPGSFTFTIRAASADNEDSATRQFQVQILSTVRLITQGPLPEGLAGSAYSFTFTAEGGVQPYQFSVIDGQLPNGLTLNAATGVLSGTPTAPFAGSFTVRVRDAASPAAEASRLFQIRILQPLELTVLSLPTGTINVPYQVQFGAQGGVPGYSFTLVSGTLPPGVTFTPAGLLAGTPTAPHTANLLIRVTDSRGTTVQREFSLVIQQQPVNGGNLSLISAIGVSNSQNEVDVAVSSPQPDEITGTITMTVNPLTNPPVDDPAAQFISGGRTATFTIPAGQTSANFGQNPTARFQTGTTAATFVFTAVFRRAGQDATPDPAPQASLAIPVTPPTMVDLGVTRSTSTLAVVIRGFAPERNITTAILEFTRRPGAPGTSPERFDVNVAQAFTQWFGGSASQPFGSQFRLTIPVTLTGDPADITGLTVRLVGPAGTGNSLTVSF